MSRAPSVRLSLLDRLQPEEGSTVTRIREGLRRDLEDLLNTLHRVTGWPSDLAEIDNSVFNYGILDLSTANLSTEERRAAVVEEIGRTIRQFEPRLSNMRISALPNADPADRTLRLRIEAQVLIENDPEPLVLNTVIEPLSSKISLTSAPS